MGSTDMYLILQVTEEDADELAGVGLGVGEEEVPGDEVAEPAKEPAKVPKRATKLLEEMV